jgi:phosphoribosylanthranilate isomerase
MTRVKVCGLTTAADRDAAVAAGADAPGLVVDVPKETARELLPERAAELVTGAPPFVTPVLVTMPADADRAVELHRRTEADAVQLHNDLSPETVAAVAERTGAPVLKAISAAPEAARQHAPIADALLVDSRDSRGAGGTGEATDWDATRTIARAVDVPVVVAGGLTPETVATAVETVEPFAVDVSSGVEREEGRKDHEAIRRFVAAAKRQPVSP